MGLARTLRGAWRATGITVAACWAVAVGLTRVYLGVHWPTDVLGGWLFGTLLTVLAAAALPHAAGPPGGWTGQARCLRSVWTSSTRAASCRTATITISVGTERADSSPASAPPATAATPCTAANMP
jgi:PAP2 superfamily